MRYLFTAVTLSSAFVLATASPVTPQADVVRVLYTFTDDAYPENIAVRANGEIIINSVTKGRVYTIDPTEQSPTAHTLVQFDPQLANGTLGIVEYAPDKFAVNAAVIDLVNFTSTNAAIWSIDLKGRPKGSSSLVKPHKLADIPNAGVANGLTSLNGRVLLAADSKLGLIWSIDIHTGSVRVTAETDALKTPDSNGLPFGVNGVHASRDGSRLFFSNTNTRRVSEVRVRHDGTFVGNITTAAELPAGQLGADDFIVGPDRSLWVTGVPNFVNKFSPDGTVVVVDSFNNPNGPGPNGASNPTAVAFGRGSKEQEKILYVTTSWGVVYAVDTSRV